MPQVPEQSAPTVGLQSGSLGAYSPQQPEGVNLSGALAAGAGALGGAVGNVSSLLDQRAQTLQALNNKAASDDAFVNFTQTANQAAVEFTTNVRGKDALVALPTTMKTLEATRKEVADTMTNPLAREMFNSASRRQLASLTGEMSRHAASEQRAYVKGSSTAKIDAAADSAATHYADPSLRAQAMGTIAEEVGFQGRLDGLSDEQITENTRKVQSDAWKSILTRMATDDPIGARDLFLENAPGMTAQDQGTMARYLKSAAQPVEAASIADAIVRQGADEGTPADPKITAMMSADPPKFFSALAGGEVRVTSAKRSEEENARVGGSKTSAHLSGEAWDLVPPKGMTTAQLAGKLAASGVPFDQIIDEGDHVHFGLGGKMRNDVLKKSGDKFISLGKGGAPPPSAKDLEARLPSMIEAARDAATALHPEDPTFADLAEQRVTAAVRRATAAENLSQTQAQNNLIQALDGGMDGGGMKPTDVEGLLKSYPGAQADWMKLDAKDRHALMGALTSNAYVTPREATPDQTNLYYELRGMAQSDPAKFAAQNILGSSMPQAWKSQLIGQQLKIRAGQEAKTGLEPALKVANSYLIQAGINQASDIKAYNQFKGQLEDGLETFQTVYARKPTEKEVITITNNLLMKYKGKPLYEAPSPVGVVKDVPNYFVKQIVEEARAAGYAGTISADQIRAAHKINQERRNAR